MTTVGASTVVTDVESVSEMVKFDDVSLGDSGGAVDEASSTATGKTWNSHENAEKDRRGPQSPSKSTQSTPSSSATNSWTR